MSKTIFDSRNQDLIVGDMVYHLLYGSGWLAILLKIIKDESATGDLAMVCMLPGLEHSNHFQKALTIRKINDNMGYVSSHWLRKYDASKSKKG